MKVTIIALLLPIISFCQKKDTVLKYLDQNLNITSQKNSVYVGVAIKGNNNWFLYALYPDTTPLLKAYFKDKDLQIKDGPYLLYYPKYKKAKEGIFHNNKMVGVWKFYHANGNIKDSGLMNNDRLTGLWKSWYDDGSLMSESYYSDSIINTDNLITTLSNTSQDVRNGPYVSWYQNGKKEAKGKFINNKMEGKWEWFFENGNPATIEEYKNGVIINLKCFDSSGKEMDDYCSIAKPALLKKYGNFRNYILENLTWPDEARKKKIQGDVTVSFKVTKEGSIVNLLIKSDYPILNKAIEELFATMKEWYPAISHNRVIDVEEEFIIPFRLNN